MDKDMIERLKKSGYILTIAEAERQGKINPDLNQIRMSKHMKEICGRVQGGIGTGSEEHQNEQAGSMEAEVSRKMAMIFDGVMHRVPDPVERIHARAGVKAGSPFLPGKNDQAAAAAYLESLQNVRGFRPIVLPAGECEPVWIKSGPESPVISHLARNKRIRKKWAKEYDPVAFRKMTIEFPEITIEGRLDPDTFSRILGEARQVQYSLDGQEWLDSIPEPGDGREVMAKHEFLLPMFTPENLDFSPIKTRAEILTEEYVRQQEEMMLDISRACSVPKECFQSDDPLKDIEKAAAELSKIHGFHIEPRVALQALRTGFEVASLFLGSFVQACKAISDAMSNLEDYAKIFRCAGISLKWWERLYIWFCRKAGLQLKAQRYILKKMDREFPGPESEE